MPDSEQQEDQGHFPDTVAQSSLDGADAGANGCDPVSGNSDNGRMRAFTVVIALCVLAALAFYSYVKKSKNSSNCMVNPSAC